MAGVCRSGLVAGLGQFGALQLLRPEFPLRGHRTHEGTITSVTSTQIIGERLADFCGVRRVVSGAVDKVVGLTPSTLVFDIVVEVLMM